MFHLITNDQKNPFNSLPFRQCVQSYYHYDFYAKKPKLNKQTNKQNKKNKTKQNSGSWRKQKSAARAAITILMQPSSPSARQQF